jgi:hypothetical protein
LVSRRASISTRRNRNRSTVNTPNTSWLGNVLASRGSNPSSSKSAVFAAAGHPKNLRATHTAIAYDSVWRMTFDVRYTL